MSISYDVGFFCLEFLVEFLVECLDCVDLGQVVLVACYYLCYLRGYNLMYK